MKRKYKLLIVDDVLIKGLRETIDWTSLDIEIVGEYHDGIQALEAIHKLQPDLVISDIRLPNLDGLSLAQRLSEENFDGAFIIYSGYSDFECARKAIDYGVTKYILKPIEKEVFISNIAETIRDLELERSKRAALKMYTIGLPLLKESLIERLLNGADILDIDEKLKIIGITIPSRGTVIEAVILSGDSKEMELLYHELLEAMDNFNVIGQKYSNRFVIISGLTRVSFIHNYLKEFFLRSAARSNCRMSVGISNPFGASRGICDAYKEAKMLRENYLFTTVNNIKTADEKVEGKSRKKLVNDALKIIAENYSEKLSVKKIAERLFVSESHLMHEFKKSIAKTVTGCLTEYRITKATEFLGSGVFRVNEIAPMVGYSDVRYFGQVFKEVLGVSPSEYIESIKK